LAISEDEKKVLVVANCPHAVGIRSTDDFYRRQCTGPVYLCFVLNVNRWMDALGIGIEKMNLKI
jgi:hypothetical protein